MSKSRPYTIPGTTTGSRYVFTFNDKGEVEGVKKQKEIGRPFLSVKPGSAEFEKATSSSQALNAYNVNKHKGEKDNYEKEIKKSSIEEQRKRNTDDEKKENNEEKVNLEQPSSIAERRQEAQTGQLGSKESGFGATGFENQSQLYAYPFDIDLDQDHLKITRYEYLRSSINASKPPTLEGINDKGDAAQFSAVTGVREVDGGSVLGALKGSVILPMPKVTDVNAADWGKSELNAQGMAAAGLASKLIGQPGETPDERERRLQAFKELREQRGGEEGGSVRRKTTGAIYNQIVAKTAGLLLGTDLNADTVLARQGGTVLNPNAEMLFQGPALRDFTFKYRMIARNRDEGQMIRNIIRFLKLGMAPKFRSSTYLKSPDVFSLQYKRGRGAPSNSEEGILDTVNRFSPGGLALTSINTDYAPNSYWSAYSDSQPVEITMDLNFVELRPIYYNDQVGTPTNSVGY
tara:strand:+ start:27 stop:1409 length:1383 start_codon:yes stop_codon:yes gene_type:complete